MLDIFFSNVIIDLEEGIIGGKRTVNHSSNQIAIIFVYMPICTLPSLIGVGIIVSREHEHVVPAPWEVNFQTPIPTTINTKRFVVFCILACRPREFNINHTLNSIYTHFLGSRLQQLLPQSSTTSSNFYA